MMFDFPYDNNDLDLSFHDLDDLTYPVKFCVKKKSHILRHNFTQLFFLY